MATRPMLIEDGNLSRAWARAFCELTKPGIEAIAPLVVCVAGHDSGEAAEDGVIRHALDQALEARGCHRCRTVANTLFPRSLWDPKRNRAVLYDRYRKIYHRIRKHEGNRLGTYFHRIIDFDDDPDHGNQLEFVFKAYRKGVTRRSAFQLVILDPRRDHKFTQQRGFPCLHQIALAPSKKTGTLSVTGFYATQYVFERAYGNYLGLADLGSFVAHELHLSLIRVTCVAAVAALGMLPRGVARNLVAEIQDRINPKTSGPEAGHAVSKQ